MIAFRQLSVSRLLGWLVVSAVFLNPCVGADRKLTH